MASLDLSDAQKSKIDKVLQELWHKQWSVMQTMHSEMGAIYQAFSNGKDPEGDAIIKAQEKMVDLRLKMLQNRLDTQKQIDAVLTDKQREKLSGFYGWDR